MPTFLVAKKPKHKQKQYCIRLNKDFKNCPHQKKYILKRKKKGGWEGGRGKGKRKEDGKEEEERAEGRKAYLIYLPNVITLIWDPPVSTHLT